MPEDRPSAIRALAKMASTPEISGKIGKQILAEALRAAAEEKIGIKPADPSVRIVLRRGDPIPSSLRALPGLRLDGETAASDWENTWTDLGPWERSWHESGTEIAVRPGLSRFRFALRARTILDPEELEIVEELGVIPD